MDESGTDTWKHYNEGHAERTLLQAPNGRVLFERTEGDADPLDLVRRYMGGLDVVILEGFTSSDVPKIEVFRGSEEGTRYDPSLPNASSWIALLTDTPGVDLPIPTFTFADTAWLFAISKMALNAAIEVDT